MPEDNLVFKKQGKPAPNYSTTTESQKGFSHDALDHDIFSVLEKRHATRHAQESNANHSKTVTGVKKVTGHPSNPSKHLDSEASLNSPSPSGKTDKVSSSSLANTHLRKETKPKSVACVVSGSRLAVPTFHKEKSSREEGGIGVGSLKTSSSPPEDKSAWNRWLPLALFGSMAPAVIVGLLKLQSLRRSKKAAQDQKPRDALDRSQDVDRITETANQHEGKQKFVVDCQFARAQ
eukprot:GHVT01029243.1.p1 GENE.GHVT01029243.1~~GHVT01029243.1.p1  ORF type:complete len:263 (-),score=33.59 GHVT01029243.1:1039-1740(-)